MKKTISFILSLLIFCSSFVVVSAENIYSQQNKTLKIVGKELYCYLDSTKIPLSDKAYMYGGKVYIPFEDVVPKAGFTIEWDSSLNAYSCLKNGEVSFVFPARNNIWVGPTEYVFDTKPFILSSRTYVSEDLFYALTGYSVKCEGEIEMRRNVTIAGGENYCYVGGEYTEIAHNAFIYKNKIYIPIHETLPKLGFVLDWDFTTSGYTCLKNGEVSFIFPTGNNIWVGPTEYVFENKPIVINGQTLIPQDMFTTLTGAEVLVEGEIPYYKNRNSINLSKRNDAYRLAGSSVVSGGGVTVVDGFGMELPSISESSAKAYASVINSVAASLDANIDVYNIIVPTAAEYYAPLRLYPNQLSGIQMIYSNLSDRVTPVNVYDILGEKAGEKIYFKTDHHWTQRGAYYAYTEFMNYFDGEVDDISTFENYPSYSHVGSLAGFAKGTSAGNIMKNSPELLERFIPKYATTGRVYSDQYLSRFTHSVSAVNTNVNAYHNYIGGDNPITIFETTAQSDRTLVIIKESFGNAFATWALNNFKRVCIIDPRRFNGFNGSGNTLNLNQLCRRVGATDVLFINYPIVPSSSAIRSSILKMSY